MAKILYLDSTSRAKIVARILRGAGHEVDQCDLVEEIDGAISTHATFDIVICGSDWRTLDRNISDVQTLREGIWKTNPIIFLSSVEKENIPFDFVVWRVDFLQMPPAGQAELVELVEKVLRPPEA